MCGEVFQLPKLEKRCCVCGVDLAGTRRTRDMSGSYYCRPCWTDAVASGRAVDLRPVAVSRSSHLTATSKAKVVDAVESVAADPALPRLFATGKGKSIVVYVTSVPQATKERSRAAFVAGFYGAAGVMAALTLVALGLGLYGAGSLYLSKSAPGPGLTPPPVADLRLEQEPALIEEGAAPAQAALARAIRLEASATPDGALQVRARNISDCRIDHVDVEVVSGTQAVVIGRVPIGSVPAGATREISTNLPLLRDSVVAGHTARVRVQVSG